MAVESAWNWLDVVVVFASLIFFAIELANPPKEGEQTVDINS